MDKMGRIVLIHFRPTISMERVFFEKEEQHFKKYFFYFYIWSVTRSDHKYTGIELVSVSFY